jgi:hypothetical protein
LRIHQKYLYAEETGGCMLQGSSKKENELFERLKPLFNKTLINTWFNIQLSNFLSLLISSYKHSNEKYNYYFGFCIEPAEAKERNKSVGMVQERKDDPKQYVVGRFKDIDVEGTGTNSK